MIGIFKKLIEMAIHVGSITEASMFEDGFMSIKGKTSGNKSFTLSLVVKEEQKDA